MVAASSGISSLAIDAVGYAGGAALALCLIPQVAKIVITRSARDISVAWSILYLIGLSLSMAYLIMKDAMAAWLPIIVEVAGCLLILVLKLFYEHTAAGRRWAAAAAAKATFQWDSPLNKLSGAHRAALDTSPWHDGTSCSCDVSLHGSKHGTSHIEGQPQQLSEEYVSHLAVVCDMQGSSGDSIAAEAEACSNNQQLQQLKHHHQQQQP
jgi:uncharacterized protein with PQ loop repeat